MFNNIERFLSYYTFYPQEKVAPSLIRVEKNFFKIVHKGYQKKWTFALISKMCRSLELSKRDKYFTEKQIFGDFLTLIRDGAIFLEVKRSNKIETVQYFKNLFL